MPGKSANPHPEHLLQHFTKQWNLLLPVATWVMTTIGSFWVPPPPDLPGENEKMLSFAKFIVMILTGLMILPMIKWCCKKRHAWLWGKITAVTLILGILAFFTYQILLSSWTVNEGDRMVYVGRTLTQHAAEYKQNHPELNKRQLLERAGWDPKIVWTEESLLICRFILSGVYVLCTPFFAITLMAVAQVIYCVKKGKT